ncbi:MAG: ABC transporter permease [Actinomycetota bacterium]
MGRYLIRRLLQMIPVVLGAIVIIYMALYVIPGDPVRAIVGERPITEEFRQNITEKYGLDDPLPERIVKYVGRLARFDLGESYTTRQDVSEIIKQRLPTTLRLAMAGILFLVTLGIASGVISASRRYSLSDSSVTLAAIVLVSVPVFVLGVLLQIFVALKLKSVLGLPITGLTDGLKSYILPGFTLASVSMAYLSRVQRTTLLETLDADYVRTARAKGIPESRVLVRHAWRNSLIPVVTFLGVDAGQLLTGAILTETVFNINGLGRTLAIAVTAQDNQVVLGISIFAVFLYLFLNLVVDLAYAWLDPRIRYS